MDRKSTRFSVLRVTRRRLAVVALFVVAWFLWHYFTRVQLALIQTFSGFFERKGGFWGH